MVCGGDVVNGSHTHTDTHKDKEASERRRAAGDLRRPVVLESWVGVVWVGEWGGASGVSRFSDRERERGSGILGMC